MRDKNRDNNLKFQSVKDDSSMLKDLSHSRCEIM